MKPRYDVTQGLEITTFCDGSVTTISKPAKLHIVTPTPADGNNPGNLVDPTPWMYKVKRANLFTGTRIGSFCTSSWGSYQCPVTTGLLYAENGEPLNGPSWERSRNYNAALSKLNDRVRDTADWAEDLARPKEARDLFDLKRNVKRLANQSKKNALKGLASGFLQFKYGWQPLLGNVYDTANALMQRAYEGAWIDAGYTVPMDRTYRTPNMACGATGIDDQFVTHTDTGKQGCRIYIKVKPMSGLNLSDFTTLNPLYLGWNLIPWSFVVDWFIDVGGWLKATEDAIKYHTLFEKGYFTELYVNNAVETGAFGTCKHNIRHEDLFASRFDLEFQRTVLNTWPLPRIPVLAPDLGSGRLLAAAALLAGLLGDKR